MAVRGSASHGGRGCGGLGLPGVRILAVRSSRGTVNVWGGGVGWRQLRNWWDSCDCLAPVRCLADGWGHR
jgi:hypothetical protein